MNDFTVNYMNWDVDDFTVNYMNRNRLDVDDWPVNNRNWNFCGMISRCLFIAPKISICIPYLGRKLFYGAEQRIHKQMPLRR